MPFFVSFLFLTLFFSFCFLLFCPCFPLFLSYIFPLLPTKWLAALEQCSRAPALCRTLHNCPCPKLSAPCLILPFSFLQTRSVSQQRICECSMSRRRTKHRRVSNHQHLLLPILLLPSILRPTRTETRHSFDYL